MKTMYIFLSLIILNNCQLSAPVPQDRTTEVWAPATIQKDKSKAYFWGCIWIPDGLPILFAVESIINPKTPVELMLLVFY